jgi:hypothetical protein
LHWLATATAIPHLRGALHHVDVTARDGHVAVAVDGKAALDVAVALPSQVLLGFTAANGGLNDRHAVANVHIH